MFFLCFQDPINPGRKLLRPAYENLVPPVVYSTRAKDSELCQCTVCDIARVKTKPGNINYLTSQGKGLPPQFHQLLFPSEPLTPPNSLATPGTTKRCDLCGSIVGKGRSHKCNKVTARTNTLGLIRTMSLKSKERTTRDALMTIFEEKGVTKSPKSGSKTTLATGGRRVNIVYGGSPAKNDVKKRNWTKDSLMKLQSALNLSDRNILWVYIF